MTRLDNWRTFYSYFSQISLIGETVREVLIKESEREWQSALKRTIIDG